MKNTQNLNRKINIGFISTRLSGTDGVSLEAAKWCQVLEEDGFNCFFMAGELDRLEGKSVIVPEMHFNHPEILAITQACFGSQHRNPIITKRIYELKEKFKSDIYSFIKEFGINLLIPENALAIPINIPLGLAICEVIAETGIMTIAHHHDFYWERKRFLVNAVGDYLSMAFPPKLPTIRHVVINSIAERELSYRIGISSMLVPNVMDYEKPHVHGNGYSSDIRYALGIEDDEFFILQPTRVVQRKGIEHAIELVSRLDLKAKLVISHASGDEGQSYERRLMEYAKLLNVNTVFVSEVIGRERGMTKDRQKIYNLSDAYTHCDLITYPSYAEGFGNAFLEAVYYRKPIFVNNYSTFSTDIKPKGFRAIIFDGHITEETLKQAREVLLNPSICKEMTDYNYELGLKYFSFSVLKQKLRTLIADCFGVSQ
jgi:glycosyltransferase involved in cell wall biosynthesis